MKPCLKPILKGHRGHVELKAKAFKTEVSLFFHLPNMGVKRGILQCEVSLDFEVEGLNFIDSINDQFLLLDW